MPAPPATASQQALPSAGQKLTVGAKAPTTMLIRCALSHPTADSVARHRRASARSRMASLVVGDSARTDAPHVFLVGPILFLEIIGEDSSFYVSIPL